MIFSHFRHKLHGSQGDIKDGEVSLHPITSVYYSNWSIYERKHFPTDINFEVVNQVYYAFLTIDSHEGKVIFSDTWADMEIPLVSPLDSSKKVKGLVAQFRELKVKYPHLKVCFSVGGWGSDGLFEAVAHDKRKMKNFVASCIDLVTTHGFDGIDIDWEYPKNATQCESFTTILQLLRIELDQLNHNLLLSVAVPGSKDNVQYLDVPAINPLLNYWNIMCYDFTGSWSDHTGFHSNLFGHNGGNDLSADKAVKDYLAAGVSPLKLTLGMPLYGRKFGGVVHPIIGAKYKNDFSDEGIVEYKDLPLGHEKFDYRKVAAYCYDPATKLLVVYDNKQSMKVKARYIISNNLAGGFFWDAAGDNGLVQEFTQEIAQELAHSHH